MELTLLTAADRSGACRVAVRAGLGPMTAGRTGPVGPAPMAAGLTGGTDVTGDGDQVASRREGAGEPRLGIIMPAQIGRDELRELTGQGGPLGQGRPAGG